MGKLTEESGSICTWLIEISRNVNAPDWLRGSSRKHELLRNILIPKFRPLASLIMLLLDNNNQADHLARFCFKVDIFKATETAK